MSRLSVNEAKTHFSEVLRRVEAGEIVIVTRHNQPIAEIKPLNEPRRPIRLGAFEGEIVIPGDAFGPLTEEDLIDWYGEE
jgi:prevent-host-death family protein